MASSLQLGPFPRPCHRVRLLSDLWSAQTLETIEPHHRRGPLSQTGFGPSARLVPPPLPAPPLRLSGTRILDFTFPSGGNMQYAAFNGLQQVRREGGRV